MSVATGRPLNVLVFGAHPDDDESKAGGVAALYSRLGHRENLQEWKGQGNRYFRVVPLKTFAGFNVDIRWWHSTG